MDVQQLELKRAIEDFRRHIGADDDDFEADGPIGEYKAAEYIIFSLALSTYIRHLGESVEFRLQQLRMELERLNKATERGLAKPQETEERYRAVTEEITKLEAIGEDPIDDHAKRGLMLLRRLDGELETFQRFMEGHLQRDSQKKMLDRALRRPARNAGGAGRRAQDIRTLLNRDPQVIKGVFETAQSRKQIKIAIAAHLMADGDAALDQFAAIPASVIRNPLIRKWVQQAAELAQPLVALAGEEFELVPGGEQVLVPEPGETPTPRVNPVDEATTATLGQTNRLLVQQAQQEGTTGAEEIQQAQQAQQATLAAVEQQAAAAAREAMERSGEIDEPPNRSDVVGIATAAVAAVLSDPSDPRNIPETIKHLDPEQRAAALTDGRVLVAAGAGAGKSTTLVTRVHHLVRDRGVSPNRLLVTSFNTDAAEELRVKIAKKVGPQAATRENVGTMHSLFKRFILKYGNPDERDAMRGDPKKTANMTARTVQNIWSACFDKETNPTPPLKEVKQQMELWVGNNVSVQQAKDEATTAKQVVAAQWYEMYEGLKGGLGPGWEPPCEEKAREAADEDYNQKYNVWLDRGGRGSAPKKPMTSYEWYKGEVRSEGQRAGDFNDMIRMFRDLLKRRPDVRKEVQKLFDHVLVDECVHQDTEVITRDGTKRVGDIQPGDEVLSFENGSAVFKRVLDKKRSRRSEGILVRTTAGRELAMTTNHRLYASSFGAVPDGSLALYLMYRRDKGFRIGTSSSPVLRKGPSGPRPNAERADALWVLEVGEPSEILFKEQALSLRHQVPTYLFEGEVRGCDQERIDRIFGEFGENGRGLLKEYELDFDYPHWTNSTYTGAGRDRRVLTISAHQGKERGAGTSATMSWTGGDASLEGCGSVFDLKGGRKLLTRRLANYVELRKFAVDLANRCGVRVVERLPIEGDQTYTLTTAGALVVGMALPVWLGGWAEDKDNLLRGSRTRAVADKYRVPIPVRGAVSSALYHEIRARQLEAHDPDPLPELDGTRMGSDVVMEITPLRGEVFYDITVEDTANFFANGILSHNCQDLNAVQFEAFQLMTEHITDGADGRSMWMVGDDSQSIYGFRGARPDLFQGLYDQEGWTTRMIRTNYRCAPEIIDHANKLIAHNETRIPMEATANPTRPRGAAKIEVLVPPDSETAAMDVVKQIVEAKDADPKVGNSDFAVLCRTRAELNAYEASCLIKGLPYVRKGSSSFLGAPEIKGVLGYVDLTMGTDNGKLQSALGSIINVPRRFWGLDMEQSERAVKDAINDYARMTRMDVKAINPVEALRSRSFREALAKRLKAGYPNSRKYAQVMERIGDLSDFIDSLQASAEQPGYTVKDMFDEVLMLEGQVREVDFETGRAVFTTRPFRESLQAATRDRDDGDDQADSAEGEDDETRGLGNISFLYEMAKIDPNNPPDTEEDPSTPAGFLRKMDQIRSSVEDLRIDPEKHKEKQKDLPPDQRTPPPGVYLGTVHSVKGLEWPNVFVQMPKGRFPIELRSKPGEPPPTDEEVQEQMEQERRLAYVALTRAATNLTVTCPRSVGGQDSGVSRFVGEAGLAEFMASPTVAPPLQSPPADTESEPMAGPIPAREASMGWGPFEPDLPWDPFARG
jgi:superfamily I DNA/RNA helicase